MPLVSTEEFVKNFENFFQKIKQLFANQANVSVKKSVDFETGKIFTIDFPISLAGLMSVPMNTRGGWINFYSDGKASFRADDAEGENCFDSEAYKNNLYSICEEYISWKEAIERLIKFLKDLAESLPKID